MVAGRSDAYVPRAATTRSLQYMLTSHPPQDGANRSSWMDCFNGYCAFASSCGSITSDSMSCPSDLNVELYRHCCGISAHWLLNLFGFFKFKL